MAATERGLAGATLLPEPAPPWRELLGRAGAWGGVVGAGFLLGFVLVVLAPRGGLGVLPVAAGARCSRSRRGPSRAWASRSSTGSRCSSRAAS